MCVCHGFDTGLLCLPFSGKKRETTQLPGHWHTNKHPRAHDCLGAETVLESGGDGAVQKEGDQSVL